MKIRERWDDRDDERRIRGCQRPEREADTQDAARSSALEGGDRSDVLLPAAQPTTVLSKLGDETTWIVRYLLPKIARVLQGRSSGDGRTAKRPHLTPFEFEPASRS